MFLEPLRFIFDDNGAYWDPTGRPWWMVRGGDTWDNDYWRWRSPVPAKPSKRNY